MDSVEDFIANTVVAIQSDDQLRNTFIRVLSLGASTQQVRVSVLLAELDKLNAPDDVKKFVRLLKDERIAHEFLKQIS